MTKVIFIPGFLGNKTHSWVVKRIFKDDDFYCFDYKTRLSQPISEIAKELNQFIESLDLKTTEKINLIGVSAGGIVATYYARKTNPKRVSKLVSVGSPFKGTFFANIFPWRLKGLKELKLGSPFLKELDNLKSKYKEKNYWCYLDIIVPGKSAKGRNSSWTWFFFHPVIHWWPPVLKSARRFFRE